MVNTTIGRTVWLAKLSEHIYQGLLRLYPREHRRAYGPLMAQVFRDLLRDAGQHKGLPGILVVCVRVFWDVLVTAPAEHLVSGSIDWSDRPVSPLPWGQVLLGILPGLLAVACRSGWVRRTFGYALGEWMAHNGLPLLCLVIVAASWALEKKLAAWSWPALGLLFYHLPAALSQWASTSSRTQGWGLYGWMIGSSLLGIGFLVRQKRHLSLSPWVLCLLALFCLLSGPFALLEVALLLAPLAVGLRLARRDKLLPVLLVAAAQYWLVDEIYDPSYGMLIWSTNETAERIVSLLPALSFLVLTPVFVWRARSSLQRVRGLLLTLLLGLFCGELVRGAVSDLSGYWARMWYPRIGGALGFVVFLACALFLYLGLERTNAPWDGEPVTELDDRTETIYSGNLHTSTSRKKQ